MLDETDARTRIVPVVLPNGVHVQVEAARTGGPEDIGAHDFAFAGATAAIEGIALALGATLEKVQPRKAAVEFQLDLSVEAGQLTALIVKGSGKGTLKITLEWERTTPSATVGPPVAGSQG